MVSHLDQQIGPFDEATLKAKWLSGEILPIDYVFDEPKQDWVLITDRFEWTKKPSQAAAAPIKPAAPIASANSSAPPPINVKKEPKKAPPPAPPEAIALAATSPSINLSSFSITDITVPSLNVPVPKEVEPVVEIELETKTSIPKPAPVSAPVVATPVVSQDTASKLMMVDGIAEVDLSTLVPGKVELVMNNAGQEIKLNLQVRSAEPAKIEWTILNMTPTVGQDLEVLCRAHDKNGHLCSEFSGPFSLKANDRDYKFEISKGSATVKFQQTKAERCILTLHNHGSKALEMPMAVNVEWQPGPAVGLILDGTPELVAGSTQKVQVKAVDKYGNLAKSFQGTLNLENKAS